MYQSSRSPNRTRLAMSWRKLTYFVTENFTQDACSNSCFALVCNEFISSSNGNVVFYKYANNPFPYTKWLTIRKLIFCSGISSGLLVNSNKGSFNADRHGNTTWTAQKAFKFCMANLHVGQRKLLRWPTWWVLQVSLQDINIKSFTNTTSRLLKALHMWFVHVRSDFVFSCK